MTAVTSAWVFEAAIILSPARAAPSAEPLNRTTAVMQPELLCIKAHPATDSSAGSLSLALCSRLGVDFGGNSGLLC